MQTNVCGLCCCLNSCQCPWVMLPLRTILIWVTCTAAWGHVYDCGLHSLWRPCPGPWFAVCTVTRSHVEARDRCSWWLGRARRLFLLWYGGPQMHSWEGETLKASVTTPTPPNATPRKKEQPRQEADKESLLNVWWRCWKVALHNWWLLVEVWKRKDSVPLKGQPLRLRSSGYTNPQSGLGFGCLVGFSFGFLFLSFSYFLFFFSLTFIFYFFWGGSHTGGQTWKDWKGIVIKKHAVKLLENQ